MGTTVSPVRRDGIPTAKLRFTPEERIKDMDELGVDIHVVSLATAWFGHHLDPAEGLKQAREVNDEIASMTKQHPTRYAGLATLPVQDVNASIDELDRSVNVLGLKGAELDAVFNGHSWDEPQFLPLFKAADEMGAVLFFHPHPQDNIVSAASNPYSLGNLFGVLVEDTLVFSALVFGGVLEKCPDLKVCIAHGAGPACFGMGPTRPWLAGAQRSTGEHQQASKPLHPPHILRHSIPQRGGAPVPHRPKLASTA